MEESLNVALVLSMMLLSVFERLGPLFCTGLLLTFVEVLVFLCILKSSLYIIERGRTRLDELKVL